MVNAINVNQTFGVQGEMKSTPALRTRHLMLEAHRLMNAFVTWDGTDPRTIVLPNVEMVLLLVKKIVTMETQLNSTDALALA